MNSIQASSLELRGIRDMQDAARFMPGIRIQTSYGAFQQISVRGFDRVLRVARTVADLAGRTVPTADDVAEALGMRLQRAAA